METLQGKRQVHNLGLDRILTLRYVIKVIIKKWIIMSWIRIKISKIPEFWQYKC